MRDDRSFWWHAFKAMGATEILEDPRQQPVLHWKPERSNCPEVQEVLEGLIGDAPERWKAVLSNVFVGRTLEGDPNAEAWNRGRVGVVELTLQYTNVLTSYINAFDHFVFGVYAIIKEIDLSSETAQRDVDEVTRQAYAEIWDLLDSAQPMVSDVTRLVGSAAADIGMHPSRSPDVHASAVSACERWIICHEVAHHLLGHTSDPGRADAQVTRTRLLGILTEAGVVADALSLAPSPRQELEADCLGFLLAARAVDRSPDFADLYRAALGSYISLLAVTHARDDWVQGPSSTHPELETRLGAISRLVVHLSGDRPQTDGLGDHPLGLLIQLETFAIAARAHWMSRMAPDEFPPPTMLDLTSGMIDAEVRIREMFPATISRDRESRAPVNPPD